ncbi:MAG: hypothetical protein M1816_003435 [Peltula sp. TS41687]|nr:MAG: hypothetical protein M1816_003435 [Peltula sp. TS41687]
MALICTTLQIPYPGQTQGNRHLLTARSGSDNSPASNGSPDDLPSQGNNRFKGSRPIPDFYHYSSVPDPKTPKHLQPISPQAMEKEIWFFKYLLKLACRDCLLGCVKRRGRLNAQNCPKECTDKIRKKFKPGAKRKDPDGGLHIVPADLHFLTNGWICNKEAVEHETGQIPDPSPDEAAPEDQLDNQHFNTDMNPYTMESLEEDHPIISQDPTAGCRGYWASRRVIRMWNII